MRTRFLAFLCAACLLMGIMPAAWADEMITIEVLSSANPSDESVLEDNFIEAAFREKLGVDIKWTYSKELQTTLNMRATSDQLPDIFCLPSRAMLLEYAEDGYLLKLDDYADQLRDAFSFISGNIASGKVAGEIYAIACRPYGFREATWYNAKWFEENGYTGENAPKTLTELIDTARALAAMDLDGNGVNDTIGLTGSKWETFKQLFGAYGCTVPNMLTLNAEGHVVDTMLDPKFYEALELVHQLWAEDFIDHEVFTLSSSQAVEKAMIGKTVLVQEEWPSVKKEAVVENFLAMDPDAKWELVGPLPGPYGDDYVGDYHAQSFTRLYAVNAKLADDPERLAAVLRLINYVATEEGLGLTSFGIEGEHWFRNADGNVEVYPDMAQTVNFTWIYQLCGREDLSYCRVKFGEAAWEYIKASDEQSYLDNVTRLIDRPDWYNAVDAETFIEEQVMAFITGDAALTEDSWNAFLQQLDATYHYSEYLVYADEYYHMLIGA